MSGELKAVIGDFIEVCINGRDLERLDEFFAPDFIDHTAPPELPPGIPGRRIWLTKALATFPDLHAVVEAQVCEDEMVATRVTSSGTVNGQKMTTGIASFDRVVNGKIVEKWEYRDPSLTAQIAAK